ncbi:uncharacterized protein LOC141685359 [Apium graveolens]|uniref:uncharacterized protein LOC141685359 n=1 Tax=Apium graveolens TaxID=4045 RepID=UPI003D7BCBC7
MVKDEPHSKSAWTFYLDGSETTERFGAGLILTSPNGFTIQQAITFAFKAINNQADYEALLTGLRLEKSLRVKILVIHSDSQIIVKQINREYIAKNQKLAQYQVMVRNILETILDTTILQINRVEKAKANEFSKLVQNSLDLSPSVYFEKLRAPSTGEVEILCITSPEN